MQVNSTWNTSAMQRRVRKTSSSDFFLFWSNFQGQSTYLGFVSNKRREESEDGLGCDPTEPGDMFHISTLTEGNDWINAIYLELHTTPARNQIQDLLLKSCDFSALL